VLGRVTACPKDKRFQTLSISSAAEAGASLLVNTALKALLHPKSADPRANAAAA
jgi:hypothetical protein